MPLSRADYLFRPQPAADLQTNLEVHATPTTFFAPNFPGYSFGDAAGAADPLGASMPQAKTQRIEDRKTNPSGHADVDVNIASLLDSPDANARHIATNSCSTRCPRHAIAPRGRRR